MQKPFEDLRKRWKYFSQKVKSKSFALLCAMALSKWKWETSEKIEIESLGPAYHFNLKNIVKCENKHVGLTYFDVF